jgi:hypothetical protein
VDWNALMADGGRDEFGEQYEWWFDVERESYYRDMEEQCYDEKYGVFEALEEQFA